ncbi:putative secreted protein [Lysobacter dokdonensis DS-58]|uniref:Putative secreted protein n=1 Tax=Lysobacter dokdonensis DS-58 TaxID=1300345 RepID=A0A0A2WR97_9GAMM|nr:ABC-type transport auxiliary lipoprotein family protein [Lysobacter dokdonensis]KGQ20830.1 putative secreted protein [Lysobacter dokdonensis DS-58]
MTTPVRSMLAATLLAALAGCSIVPKKEPLSLYAPDATVQADPAWPQVKWALQIPRPHASELLDSPRIVVRPADGELQVYHGAIWAEPTPDLVQDAVLRAFEDSGRIGGVARRGTGINGDYELMLDIRRFESDYAGGATPNANVEIVAKLVANRANAVVATRTLKQSAPAASTKVGDVSRAFDAALTAAVTDLVGWTLVEGEKYDRAHPVPASVKR